jgi:hypothetical protein
VTDDGLRLDQSADLLDFRITDGESSWLIDGAQPIEGSTDGLVRVRIGSWREASYRSPDGAFRDSSLEVRVPEFDLTSETTHDIRIEFFTGPSPLLLVSGETTLPRPTVNYVIDFALAALGEIDWREKRFPNLAERVEFLGIGILDRRITEVERNVREALDDADFSDDDLEALRGYPDRLAAVESSARSLLNQWPEAKTAKPSSGLLAAVQPVNFDPGAYGRNVEEAQRDAKDSVARLSGLISSQQIVLTQRQARDATRFQRLLTIVGATVLVPGLVAAVFGAGVGFHGNDTTSAFWALLLLMAGSAMVTYAIVRSVEAGFWDFLHDHRPFSWALARKARTRLLVLGLLGVAVLVGGVIVLLVGPGSPPDPAPNSGRNGQKQNVTSPSTAKSKGQEQKTEKKKSDSSEAQSQKPPGPLAVTYEPRIFAGRPRSSTPLPPESPAT